MEILAKNAIRHARLAKLKPLFALHASMHYSFIKINALTNAQKEHIRKKIDALTALLIAKPAFKNRRIALLAILENF